VIVSLIHPLNTTVNGPVPLLMVTVKLVDSPRQFCAAAGEITQLGLGTQMWVAVQGVLTQPLASVTFAVKLQVPCAVHACFLLAALPTSVIVSLIHPLNTTVNGPVPLLIVTV